MVPILWVVLGVTVLVCGLRARRSRAALRAGQVALAALYLVGGALVNLVYLVRGDDYATFADGSYLPFVSDTWRSVVVPNHHFFISLLIAFELVVGLLALRGGRAAVPGLIAAIGFHVALLSFGWGFYLWSLPMLLALGLLLRAQRAVESRSALRAAEDELVSAARSDL